MQNVYAIFCYKQFVSRIRKACSHNDGTNTSDYFLISTASPKGRRKERIGYILLIINNARKSPGMLSPFARQQISWACSLNHRIRLDLLDPNITTNSSTEQKEKRQKVEEEIRIKASWNDLPQNELNHVVAEIHGQILNLDNTFFSQIQSSPPSLRISVFPNDGTEYLCRSLQAYTHQWLTNVKKGDNLHNDSSFTTNHTTSDTIISAIDPSDAFSGPIKITKSMQQATLVLHTILTSRKEVMFGISTKEEYWAQLHSKMNHHGTANIMICPTDEKTGEDKITLPTFISTDNSMNRFNETAIISRSPCYVPVSRAYYKLKQVMDEHLAHHLKQLQKTNGSCIDLGASPGGWTQVMHDCMKMNERKEGISSSLTNCCSHPVILSIDQAILARRVRELAHVCHVRQDFTNDSAIEEIAKCAPYSLVVCDASTDSNEVLTKIMETFDKVSCRIQNRIEADNTGGVLMTTPSAMVITLKMPYKSSQSMNRHLNQVVNTMPKMIQSITSWATKSTNNKFSTETINPPSMPVQYKIEHLMANSESERTLIIMLGA